MRVPFFDLKRTYQQQKTEIDRAVQGALDSGWYILGEIGGAFEREFADSVGAPGGFLGCNSGTDSLVLAMLASGIGAGDEVITSSHTAIPTISAIRSIGATPVFVDVDPDTWLMDVGQLARSLTPATKAVILVHLYGPMIDVPRVKGILRDAGRPEISVIEDVAQAHGSKWNGQEAGSLGRFGCYSFYPTKNIGCMGDGGGVFCGDAQDLQRIRVLRNYGQKDRYHAQYARGINSRLDEIQSAILRVKLPHLDAWNETKARMVATYQSELQGLPLRFQKVPSNCAPAWHLCVIRLESRSVRDQLIAYLKEKGVDTIIHYPIPTHLQPAISGDRPPHLPVTEALAGEIVSIPMNVGLTREEQNHVVRQIRAFFH